MSVLITGSHGYIGTVLRNKLDEKCWVYEECDLKIGRDILYFEPQFSPKIIYHLAAQSGAIPSMEDPINDACQNILGTLRAIKLANRYNARLVFPTSGGALEPESPYGLSKKTCEEYIKMLCNDYVILRLSSIYGEKPRGVVDNFIRADICTMYGDGSSVRDFVHVDDIVEAFIRGSSAPKGEYQCGSGKGVSVFELVEATGKPRKRESARTGEKGRVVLKNTLPGWEPKIHVLDYIKEKCQ